MDLWSNLCRCCLSQDSEVSLLDKDLNVKEKFLEITTVEVSEDDGLPQRLCTECYTILNSAYQFRMQCIKMNSELKSQLEALLAQTKETEIEENNQAMLEESTSMDSDGVTNETIKHLQAIIKEEPNDNDDDYYYVLVIDDKEKEQSIPEESLPDPVIKQEKIYIKQEINAMKLAEESHSQQKFENYDSYMISNTKVPVNVPDTILENEETQDDDCEYNNIEGMDIDEIHHGSSQDLPQIEDSQEKQFEVNISDIKDLQTKNSVFKILTTSADHHGTIVLKGDDGIQYLTDGQFVNDEDDGDPTNQEEVIFCEGDDASQFQILKCDGSELVIEYADGDEIATVLQQEDGTFLCDCGEQFEDLEEYEKHQYKHNPAGDHLCNLCGKGFESREILTGHMLLHSISGPLVTCPFCEVLIKRNTLTQHIKYYHNNIKPQCSVCGKTFANPNNLKRHMMIHSGIREFECDICLKRFHQKITMQTHRLTHMNPYACNQCDQTFEDKNDLQAHKDSDECSKSKVLKVKEELMKSVKQEITTNLGKLLGYACSLCKKMFSLESALEQHIENVHMTDPSELLCTECGQFLPSKKEMQSHLNGHKTCKQGTRNMKRFECSTCGKACASHAMLIMHERVHTNERPYACGLCTLRFKTKTHLRTHQLTHTRERKFGCSVCMKFFALKGNLVVHLRTHTGERPYVCSLCDEAFIDSKYLKKHKLKKHAIDNLPWNKY